MRIILPLPSSILSGHAKGNSHWTVSKATKASRQMAYIEGLNVRGEAKPCRGNRRISYYFYVPDKRARDAANMVHGAKPMIDGLVDAGVIYKDDWMHLMIDAVCVEVCKENPRMELEIQ